MAPVEHSDTLALVVDQLCDSNKGGKENILRGPGRKILPSREVVVAIVEDLRSALFPGYFGTTELNNKSMRFHVGSTLDRVQISLGEQIRRGFCFVCEQDTPDLCGECDVKAAEASRTFLSELPHIRQMLITDIWAAFEGDPAAGSPDEAIFCYPGIQAVMNYRLAHALHLLNVPLIPRMITEHAHSITGIDIHPAATIGESFFIDHGTGVVIGETCQIGKNVRIYQGVTLGAKSFPLDENNKPVKGIPRHPIVEDDVIIYSDATILGRVRIGRGSVIGGNVWLTKDVPAGSRMTQARILKEKFENGSGI